MERLFRADQYFDPRDIASFDGRGWEGVVLDETTRDDLKKQFRTKGGSFVRPEATILTPAPGARWEIQALQDANNGKARITGFHVASTSVHVPVTLPVAGSATALHVPPSVRPVLLRALQVFGSRWPWPVRPGDVSARRPDPPSATRNSRHTTRSGFRGTHYLES